MTFGANGLHEQATIFGQRTMKAIVIALVFCLACSLAQAVDLSGVPRVVDGDTLAIGATRIRLEGIDAPETDQVCLNANGLTNSSSMLRRDRDRTCFRDWY